MKNYLLLTVIILLSAVVLCTATLSNNGLKPLRSSQPPQDYTGAIAGVYCTDCHSSFGLNTVGGSVVATGLPVGNYTAGQQYNFSIATNHFTSDRKKWGFSIAARNSLEQAVGSFSSTNTNAAINGNELSHLNAVATGLQSAFTYTNLRWTAPLNPGVNDQQITFYIVGLAANSNSNTAGDYVYATTIDAALAVVYSFTGNGNWGNAANWSNGVIPPANLTGNAEIIIDPVIGGTCILDIEQRISNSSKLTVKSGKHLSVNGNLIIAN